MGSRDLCSNEGVVSEEITEGKRCRLLGMQAQRV